MRIPLSLALFWFFLILPACSSSSALPISKKVTPQTIKQEFMEHVVRPCARKEYNEVSHILSFEEFYNHAQEVLAPVMKDVVTDYPDKPRPTRMKLYKTLQDMTCIWSGPSVLIDPSLKGAPIESPTETLYRQEIIEFVLKPCLSSMAKKRMQEVSSDLLKRAETKLVELYRESVRGKPLEVRMVFYKAFRLNCNK